MFPFVALHVSASVSFCSTHILHDICLQFVLVVLCYIGIVVLIWQAPLFLCKTISFYGYGQQGKDYLGSFPMHATEKMVSIQLFSAYCWFNIFQSPHVNHIFCMERLITSSLWGSIFFIYFLCCDHKFKDIYRVYLIACGAKSSTHMT